MLRLQVLQLVDGVRHRGTNRGIVHRAVAVYTEHEVARVALALEVLTEHVERALRLRSRQRERFLQRAARDFAEDADRDERDDPSDDDETAMAVTPSGEPGKHVRQAMCRV